MIVMKFGGTSVGSAESITALVGIVASFSKSGKSPFVVVSAVSGVTDLLLASARKALEKGVLVGELVKGIRDKHSLLARQLGVPEEVYFAELTELEHVLFGVSLVRELTPRTTDRIASFGERVSARIVAAFARNNGLNARAFDAYDLGMVTDGSFGNAEILPATQALIRKAVKGIPRGVIPVVTGFIGRTGDGDITTLGRGGSDYSASIYGAALGAEEIQIWTDVDGVMTADPRMVPDARTVGVVSFEEASELAYFGAKVLHPKTIIPAMEKDIPVRVLNTFNPSGKGTTILRTVSRDGSITAITSKKNILVININSARMLLAYGFMEKVFSLFSEYRISVDMIATSEVNVTVTLERKYDVSGLVERLKEFANVTVLSGRASISVVGEGARSRPGTGARIFSVLGREGINVEMTSQSYNDVGVSVVVREESLNEAVLALHGEFFGGVQGKRAVKAAHRGKVKFTRG